MALYFSPEEVSKRLKEIPKNILDLIYSDEASTVIKAIGNSHNLHIDQVGSLQTEVVFLMLGLIPTKDFAKNVEEQVRTDAATAEKIAKDINDKLLIKIRGSLHAIYPNNPTPVSVTTVSPTPVQGSPLTTSLAKINTPAPMVPPVVKTPPAMPLASVDAALNKPQSTPAQHIDVGIAPAKPRDYANDPYLEPIE